MNYAEQIIELVATKELDKALDLAQKWTAQEPYEAKAWSKLAFAQARHRDYESAVQSLRTALRLHPEYPPYLFKLGDYQFDLQRYSSAAESFAACAASSVAMDDDFYLDAAYVAQARCLLLDGQAEKAASVLVGVARDATTFLDGEWSCEQVLNDAQASLQKASV